MPNCSYFNDLLGPVALASGIAGQLQHKPPAITPPAHHAIFLRDLVIADADHPLRAAIAGLASGAAVPGAGQ